VELKPEYYRWATRNLDGACKQSAFSFYEPQPSAALTEEDVSPRPEPSDPARAATERREPQADVSGAGEDGPASRPRREPPPPKRLTIIGPDGEVVPL